MLNQLFTADNFRRILDYENRKGVYLEGKFFPEAHDITEKLKECADKIRKLKKKVRKLGSETREAKRLKSGIDELEDFRETLKKKKEESLTSELEKISSEITSGKFKIGLRKIEVKGKTAYTCNNNATTYFALKQLQLNIRRLYKVKQSNRNNIVCQLREVLNNSFPKFIVRTDIEDFFESIPRARLVKKIDQEPLLTTSSKKIVKQILREYENLSGNTDGIPRGVGISAYLSELYMRDLDQKIHSQDEVVFYARYVDDIVVVYSPKPSSDISDIPKKLIENIKNLGLSENSRKTKSFDLTTNGKKNFKFEYLGYKIHFTSGNVSLCLSKKRVEKYKNRIELSFDKYLSSSATNEKRARKILIKRVRFLTGNTRLLNNKKNVLVGVYFSNSLLNCSTDLRALDKVLHNKINTIPYLRLREKLQKMSFVEGFNQKRFARFSVQDLTKIVEVWKHAKT